MAIALDPALQMQWHSVRARAGSFWSWWTGELAGMLPGIIRRLIVAERPVATLDLESGEVGYVAAGGRKVSPALGRLNLDAPASVLRAQLKDILGRRSRRKLGLAVALPGVLRRRIELPAAAAGDLNAVLCLDMDRQTPFRAEDVLFTHRLLARQGEAGTISVELIVAPKDLCNRPQALAADLGLPLAYLGPTASPPWSDNLCPAPATRGHALARRVLGLVALALAGAALWLPLELDRRTADAAASRLAEAKAMEASLSAELEARAPLAAAARSIQNTGAQALPILSEITAVLPLDSWLDRIDWRDGRVQISGHARAAADIAGQLAQIPRFAAIDYDAPVTRDSDGLERFSLLLQLAVPDPVADEDGNKDETSPGERP